MESHAHTLHTALYPLSHQVHVFTSPVKPQELMSQHRLNLSPSSSPPYLHFHEIDWGRERDRGLKRERERD
jgi:hypothetical protein